MRAYRHKKIRPFSVAARFLRGITALLSAWPLILVIALFVSPVSPHLRWSYTYRDIDTNYRVYIACEYLGARGIVRYVSGDQCPLITVIDSRVYP